MKRTPLKRGKGLKRRSSMPRSSSPLRQRRLVKRQYARPVVDDGFGEPYLHFVEAHPCCMAHLGGCSGDVVGHHHRKGEHARVHKRAVPLCYTHHIRLAPARAGAAADPRADRRGLRGGD